jgi:polyphosphate kinase 2 (PPK2 family)
VLNQCGQDEYVEFLKSCAEFERVVVHSGVKLIKYWFLPGEGKPRRQRMLRNLGREARADKEARAENREVWIDEYRAAMESVFALTGSLELPWFLVRSDSRRRGRLNLIHHLLSLIPREDSLEASRVGDADRTNGREEATPKAGYVLIPEVY